MQGFADKTIAIVGLGLIGGSLARALRGANPGQRILAVDNDPQALQQAQEAGVISEACELAAAAQQADLMVLAIPPLMIETLLQDLAPLLNAHCIVTDVGSAKEQIVAAVAALDAGFRARFVPGHPIAGSEQSGFAAARAELFAERKVILTPIADNDSASVALVHEMWRGTGAEVMGMSVQRHDQVLAATSHLPHVLAFALVDSLLQLKESDDILRYAAGGFADFSRLASSDARMWADIFVANSHATAKVLDHYIDYLQQFRAGLEARDHEGMMEVFRRAKKTRDDFIARHYQKDSNTEMQAENISLEAFPGGKLSGEFRVPGDKSISHRSVIFGALADGVTEIEGFLEGEDALNTVAAFREMGVTIVGPENGKMTIYGVGMQGLKAPRKPLYMGNSGTAMRLLAGLLAAQDFASELTGDESLSRRPMNRVADPLRQMGADIQTAEGGRPPLQIKGKPLSGIDYDMQIASAQVKSCLLLAGMYAKGRTRVCEPAPCRDHTERMLQGFAWPVNLENNCASLEGGASLQATTIDVPSDISSAAFFMVAASIAPGSDILLRHVGINPTRTGILALLKQMGGDIQLLDEREVGGEPVADIRVRYSPLKGIVIPEEQIPLAIDEFPVLFVAAACAEGETVLRGAEELRVKESDRIEAMAVGLKTLGVELETYPDGIRIVGGKLGAGEIDSQGDHRIAMAFAVAALRASGPIRIADCANVATSFPGFVELANQAGLQVSQQQEKSP
jgi:3-phosphoshikimate 1-carboxyvinyltransferase